MSRLGVGRSEDATTVSPPLDMPLLRSLTGEEWTSDQGLETTLLTHCDISRRSFAVVHSAPANGKFSDKGMSLLFWMRR